MQHTPHYNMNEPDGPDLYDVRQFNQNASIIDSKLYEFENSSSNHAANRNNPHEVTKSQIGLGSVENKSSETIRSELTRTNVTDALGYTPNVVVGNPSATPTDNLTKIQIDNKVYQLATGEGTVKDVLVDNETVVDANGIARVRIKADTYYHYEIVIETGVSYYVKKFNSQGQQTSNIYYSTAELKNTDNKFTTAIFTYPGTTKTYMTMTVLEGCIEFPSGSYSFDCPEQSGTQLTKILTYTEGFEYKNLSPAYNELNRAISGKQNKLTPGANISIQSDTISITDMPEVIANPATAFVNNLENIQINGTGYKVSSVQANASTVTSQDLTSLTIDNVVYGLSDGTDVEANPAETGTTDLTSIKINQTVYNIPQGGGGSGATIVNATLYANQWSSNQQTISDAGITTSSTVIIGLANSSNQNERQQAKDGALDVSAVSAGSITVIAYGLVPSIDIPVTLILF